MAILNDDTVIFGGGIILRNIISPPLLTAIAHDYNPVGLSTANVLRVDATANRDVTGIVAQENGRTVVFINVSTHTITLQNNNVGSILANRFLIDGNININANTSRELFYDGINSRWRII